jgi:hypothetical protein
MDPAGSVPEAAIEVMPVVAISRVFPARPSWIPEIREFVRGCLAESPLSPEETRQVDDTVSRALLEAAGPTGAIQVTFRIFPDHAEVDVLRSTPDGADYADNDLTRALRSVDHPAPVPSVTPPTASPVDPARTAAHGPPASFAEWMAEVLENEGISHEAAARQLGVSVKTVGRWVGGETEPRLRDLRRIREVFGRTPFT